MFERFTERARQVVVLAQDEARHLHHDEIDVLHILIGLIKEEEGLAARVLIKEFAFEVEDVHEIFPPRDAEPIPGQIPFTDAAKKVLESSLREALSMGHNYIGTEHILLSLIRYADDRTEDFFEARLGRRWQEAIELEVIELLRGPKPPTTTTNAKNDGTEASDLIADFLTGFKRWHDEKIQHADDISDGDETFIRWVEASKLGDYL